MFGKYKVINTYDSYHSDGNGHGYHLSLLPVVTLKANVSMDLINSGDGSSPETAYVLK